MKPKWQSNAGHLAKLGRIVLQPYKDEADAIRAAAAAAGQSLQGYCLEAVRQRMAEDSPGGATVCKIRTEAVEPWAKAAGQSVREYVAAAVKERRAADKMGKKP